MDTPLDLLLVLALYSVASARVAVLMVHDTILQPIRHRIFLRWPPEDDVALGFRYQSLGREGHPLPAGLRRDRVLMSELLTCTRCVTVWTTAMFYLAGVVFGDPIVVLVAAPIAAMYVAAWLAGQL